MHIGSLLKENHAISNYIYDEWGYRIGVVVAKNSGDRNNPLIGWALFDEVPHQKVIHRYIHNIPNVCKKYPDFKKEVGRIWHPTFESLVSNPQAQQDLFQLALDRANTNYETFYVDTVPAHGQMDADLLNNIIGRCPVVSDDHGGYRVLGPGPMLNPTLAGHIRKAVRRMGFRAYRYFQH